MTRKMSTESKIKRHKPILREYQLYLMIIPTMLYFIIFHYGAFYGLQIAFKDFNAAQGIWGSPWVGFEQFERLFRNYNFGIIIRNTFMLSLESLLITFPIPIVLALLVNQVEHTRFKKSFQLISYNEQGEASGHFGSLG